MGNLLTKAVDLWENLDISHEKLGKGGSKKEFLLKLCGYSEGGRHRLDVLKSSISKEYDDDPVSADRLMALFDLIAQNWDFIMSYGDIDSLVDFLSKIGVDSATTLNLNVEEFLGGLNTHTRKVTSASSFSELIGATGFLTESLKVSRDGKVNVYRLTEYVKGSEVFVNKSPASWDVLLDLYSKGDEFAKDVVPAFSEFSQQEPLEANFFIIGKKSFHKRNDVVTVTLGGEKVSTTLKETYTVKKKRIMHCVYENDILSYDFYCVS